MNRTLAIGLLAMLSGSAPVASASFPYQAIVETREATLRSGPGNEYYATDILNKGQVVEVFRHVNNTWCAIRPPKGSFSWVLAGDVEATDSADLLRVVGQSAKTRVGSHLTQSSNVQYVSLDPHEILRVLGTIQRLPGESRLAYRIEPPAGEFRWIHHRHLERLSESSEASARPTGSGVVLASYAEDDDSIRLEKLPGGSMQTVPITGQAARQAPVTSPRSFQLEANQHQRRLKTLSALLSRTVSMPVESWNLVPLQAELDSIVINAPDTATRKEATELLNRLVQFDRIQKRHRALAASSRKSADRLPQAYRQPPKDAQKILAANGFIPWPALPPTAKTATESSTVYEGEGWLIPVFTKRRDLPSFALTDNDGAILYFVTPRPGLNLRRYLRKRVGIIGSVVNTSTNEQAQLKAERIVMLDRHRR